MTESIIYSTQNRSSKNIALFLLSISMIVSIYSFFAIVGGVFAVLLFIASVVALIIFLIRKRPIKIILLTILTTIFTICIAGLGLFLQLKNVQNNCGQYSDPSSTEHIECFQENYSPWQGIIQAIKE